tara:strand:+ start:994 stop:1185 length:192 start_codon:yes stop_codon:yes gene_type:complete
MSNSNGSNGLTQKEMLMMVLEGQEKINERIDSLHEKVNAKISRQELAGWVVIVGTVSALFSQM